MISTGADWTFELLERYDEVIGGIAAEYGLDTYANQIEVITSEQMLDAYASSGLPVGYPHWSYGKEFIRNEQAYRRGDALEKRRKLMDAWTGFIEPKAANVVSLKPRA